MIRPGDHVILILAIAWILLDSTQLKYGKMLLGTTLIAIGLCGESFSALALLNLHEISVYRWLSPPLSVDTIYRGVGSFSKR